MFLRFGLAGADETEGRTCDDQGQADSPAMILSTLIILTGAVGDARAQCDDYCPFDSGNALTHCEEPDIGAATCYYDDGHYYADFGGC